MSARRLDTKFFARRDFVGAFSLHPNFAPILSAMRPLRAGKTGIVYDDCARQCTARHDRARRGPTGTGVSTTNEYLFPGVDLVEVDLHQTADLLRLFETTSLTSVPPCCVATPRELHKVLITLT